MRHALTTTVEKSMSKQTPLYQEHVRLGAKIVDFGGWQMPLHYGSQLEEHEHVRRDAGWFDVSHMTIVDLLGVGGRAFLRYLLANDVDKLQQGQALYSCMLNDQGGVIDDLIVYYRGSDSYRLVLNASTRDKDLAWIHKQAVGFSIGVQERTDLAMIAVQGPTAISKLQSIAPQFEALTSLKNFYTLELADLFIARTGYTGEDGVEIILPKNQIVEFTHKLLECGVKPCGLGARDTLRLEAGLNLYGSDMTEETSPLESNLAWTIAWSPDDREFIGRTALELQKRAGVRQKLVGLILEDKGVMRSHQKVNVPNIGEGEITSGTFSPTLNCSIALARVPIATTQTCFVDIRGKLISARVVKPRFVKNGKSIVENS